MMATAQRSDLDPPRKVEFPAGFLGQLLADGLQEGTSIALSGPPSAGKTIFCETLIEGFLDSDIGCIYITLDRSPSEIRNDLHELGTDVSKLEDKKRLVFVDGYSWLAGSSAETFRVENLANLPELIILIDRTFSRVNGRIFLVLDSMSPLLVHNPETDVIKFLQMLAARIKKYKGIGIFVVQAGVHSQEFYNAVAYLVDGVFSMKIEEEEGKLCRYFRISSLRSLPHRADWVPFIINSHEGFRLQDLEVSN